MSRSPMLVRDARVEDVSDLLTVWAEAGHGIEIDPAFESEARRALANVSANPEERLLVCETEGRVVAALSLRRAPLGPLHTEDVVHTSYLLVLPQYRRHGCAHLLLEAAVLWAEEKGIEHVTAITASASRDSNRFLARLGLGQVATIRVAATASLRDRLHPAPTRSVGRILAQRRSMRRRTES